MKKLFSLCLTFICIFFSSCIKVNSLSLSDTYPNFLNARSYNAEAFQLDDYLLIVNTNHHLDKTYHPQDLKSVSESNIKYIKRENEDISLKKVVLENLEMMIHDMSRSSLEVVVYSGYRSYDKQVQVFNATPEKNEVAIPGYSEHQTALAVDIATLETGLTINFSYTKEYLWLLNNSYNYGFILRYPQNKESITGYNFESWHFRYVGKHAAMIKNQISLEEYLYLNY